MFVKKLVDRASIKKPDGSFESLSYDEVDPRLVFHYGIPTGSILLAYDSVQKILAISTKDGRIKLLGRDNTQALLESNEAVASKHLQFIQNQGTLLNVTAGNHIEVWDVDKKLLSHVYISKDEITSFTVMQQCPYIYVGDAVGNISILKLEQDLRRMVPMKYNIPFSESHGITSDVAADTAVTHVLPQPAAETKRVLLIFSDGFIALWAIRESRVIFTAGQSAHSSLNHEKKKVTSACWACPFGSKVVVGYSTGDIFIWGVSPNSKCESTVQRELSGYQNDPICKLNLGYKLDKIPIQMLKWVYADGKASRLYVMGGSDSAPTPTNMLQIILLHEHSNSRIIKLAIQPPEACIDMEIISSSDEQCKHKQDSFLLLGKSGNIYIYDDNFIEKYLLQSQSKSSPSIPKEVKVRLPFSDSSITVAKFITDNPHFISFADKDYDVLAKNMEPLLPFDLKSKEGTHLSSPRLGCFSKIKNLYITGHYNGSINFWDLSCQALIPVLSLKQQSEDDLSLSGVALSALCFDDNSRVLVSGDQNGMVRIYKFRSELYGAENSLMSITGSTKKANNYIRSLKLIKVNAAVLSMSMNHNSKYLAVGSDQGYVSLIDLERHTVIYQKHIPSDLCLGIISVQFEICSFHGFEKNALLVATKDSSLLAFDTDTGNTLSTSPIQPKKPFKALLMQVLGGQETMVKESDIANGQDVSNTNSVESDAMPKQLLILLCSEKAAYIYSLKHMVQGVKKVLYKKKFHSPCSWASVFYTNSTGTGLILLFSSGNFEIRSLPELSLLKESSIRGFTLPMSKQNSISNMSICSSRDGEIVMVNLDQEIFLVSVLLKNKIYRPLDSVSKVYTRGLKVYQDASAPVVPKEKKKGFFSSVITGNKAKHAPEMECKVATVSIEELSAIFSTKNFSMGPKNGDEVALVEDEDELDIDDIDLEDLGDKPKGVNMRGALNKQKVASKFNALKGKLKQLTVDNEKGSAKGQKQDEKPDTVDQIKMKYGFPLHGESSAAKMMGNKMSENLVKLQGINTKTTEMQSTAQSFSAMANQLLRSVDQR